MKAHLIWLFAVINLLFVLSAVSAVAQSPLPINDAVVPAAPVGTAFTYQGRIRRSGVAVNNPFCDFQFSLWNALSGGAQVGGLQTKNNVPVQEGRFTVSLDFGAGAFNGEGRWLELTVRCPAGSGAFTALTPRQPLTSAPYALSVPWAGVTGKPAGFADGVDNTVTIPLDLTGSDPLAIVRIHNNGQPGNGSFANALWGVGGAGRGVEGNSTSQIGTAGYSDTYYGVYGQSNTSVGVQGDVINGGGSGYGVRGESLDANGNGVGGFANNGNNAWGVQGYSENGIGVVGGTGGGTAGVFFGDVTVTGNLTKSGGSFKIDHPLDPANKYLYHSFVESPDMKNIYDGVAALDAAGTAVVELPAWFEALNQDFRYQLTCIGEFASVYIAEEVKDNRFTIAGGKPGMKVSWQVTGIRHDPYAEQNRIPVEVEKPAEERGKYLYPQGYGQPDLKGVHYNDQKRFKQAHVPVPSRTTAP
jgi:hypothetical protein